MKTIFFDSIIDGKTIYSPFYRHYFGVTNKEIIKDLKKLSELGIIEVEFDKNECPWYSLKEKNNSTLVSGIECLVRNHGSSFFYEKMYKDLELNLIPLGSEIKIDQKLQEKSKQFANNLKF